MPLGTQPGCWAGGHPPCLRQRDRSRALRAGAAPGAAVEADPLPPLPGRKDGVKSHPHPFSPKATDQISPCLRRSHVSRRVRSVQSHAGGSSLHPETQPKWRRRSSTTHLTPWTLEITESLAPSAHLHKRKQTQWGGSDLAEGTELSGHGLLPRLLCGWQGAVPRRRRLWGGGSLQPPPHPPPR